METRVCKICKTEKGLNKDNFQPYTSSIGKKLFRLYCRECQNKKNPKNVRMQLEYSQSSY